MIKNYNFKTLVISLFVIIGMFFQSQKVDAQCFQVYDGFGVIQATPYFIGCSGSDYTIFLQTDIALGNYTIIWGDGTANSTGASLTPPSYIQHTFLSTVDTFNITITDNSTGCVTNGVVVLEEPVNASIQIPLGGVTVVCAPSPINFINSSTNVSSTTTFTWDFGDGTAPLVFGAGNAGQNVTHSYLRNTVSCETVVTLTAENYCSFGNPTIANFSPLMVYDLDTAVINATATTLCYPDTVVTFDNATLKNCLPEGNVQQRYEYWNLGDYWGLGYDSIIPWIPFDPPAQPGHTIAFPGIGSYTIMMIDSNMCGQDTGYITVTIIPPPAAGVNIANDSACVGESITFQNNSGSGANIFYWDFDDGNGFVPITGNPNMSFNDTGRTTITVIAGITGTSGVCQDTSQIDVYIKPSPIASFALDNVAACDSLTVTITDSTSGAVAWNWNLGNGNISTLANPPTQTYTTAGNYRIRLDVTHANGCTDREKQWVHVYQSPTANFSANSVCQNANATFTDLSNSPVTDPINSWDWNFGDGNSSTNQNSINVYTNTGGYQVTLIVATPHCSDTISDSVTVEVTPTAAFTLSDTTGCSPLVTTTINNSTGATNYIWDFGNGYGSNVPTPTIIYLNGDTVDTNYTLTLIASTTFGCRDTTDVQVTVFGGPDASFTNNAIPECGPVQVDFLNTSNGGVSYLWDFGDSTVTSNLENPSHIFGNTSLFITNYNVNLIVTNIQGCTDTATQVVTIYPEPNFPFSTIPDSGCSPLQVTFPAIIGAVGYTWDFGDGSTASGQSPSHIFLNNTTNDQNFMVQLIATSPFGCVDTTIELVTVYPEPTAVFTVSDTIGCGPLNIAFQNTSLNASSYLWNFGDGDTSSSTVGIINHTYYNNTPGQAVNSVSLIAMTAHGCADTATQNITVHPPVMANFTADSLGCTPLSITYGNTTLGAATYIWNFGDGGVSASANPNHTFFTGSTNDTMYQVTLMATSSFGCSDTIQDSVTVYHTATAAIATSVISGCTPLNMVLTNNSYGYDNLFLDYGDGNMLNTNFSSIPHTYINSNSTPDTLGVQLIASTIYGCNDTANTPITVYPPVMADFIADSLGCSPLPIGYTNTTQGAATYSWNFGDGGVSSATDPNHTFFTGSTNDTMYQVTLMATSSFGCSDTIQDSVTVYHTATAAIVTSVISGCTPLNVVLTNNSYGFDNVFLDYGDGNILNTNFSTTPHTYINTNVTPDTLGVQLIASTIYGCNDTANTSITVFPNVIATITGDTVGCSPVVNTFNNSSTGSTSYQWTFGNGNMSNITSPIETFTTTNQTQIFSTSLVAISMYGCADTTSINITVHPSAVASFSSNTIVGCTPLSVGFTNASFDYDNLIWDFGDGNFSNATTALVNHNYVNTNSITEIYNVELIATTIHGCNDTATSQIEVYPPVIADALLDTVGCSPYFVQFQNNSSGANTYLWDLGNGIISTLPSPDETYINQTVNPITIPVQLTSTSTYGCTDVYTNDIIVYPQPIASFLATPPVQSFPLTVVNITNNTVGTWSYDWDFGNGTSSTIQNPAPIDFLNIGSYTIQLVISNLYCADTASQLVQIMPPPPVASFSGGESGCAPVMVTFTNSSEYGNTYLWDFGDGNTSIQENPVYTYFFPGVYSVTLTVNGLSGTDIKYLAEYIMVYPNAIANFDYQPIKVSTTGDKTFFYNQSANANSYLWNFGDGNQSTDEHPIYQYQKIGTFPITLVANNDYNCPDTLTHATYISVEATGEVTFPNAFVPNANNASGGMYDANVLDNSIFHPISTGVDEYHLIIYNRWGELVFETFDINQGWDGYYKGEVSAQDAYVWKADVILVNGEHKIFSGDVTLLQ